MCVLFLSASIRPCHRGMAGNTLFINHWNSMVKFSRASKDTFANDYTPLGSSLYTTVNKNIRMMAGKFYSILSDEDIEDLVHDTYLRVMDNRDKVDPARNVNGWVFRICTNCVNSYTSGIKRRKGKTVELDEGYDDDNPTYEQDRSPFLADNSYSADTPIHHKEFNRKFWGSIQKLTPEHRDVAMMLIDDTPYNEMAESLGCSEDTLRVKVYRMRRALLKLGVAA